VSDIFQAESSRVEPEAVTPRSHPIASGSDVPAWITLPLLCLLGSAMIYNAAHLCLEMAYKVGSAQDVISYDAGTIDLGMAGIMMLAVCMVFVSGALRSFTSVQLVSLAIMPVILLEPLPRWAVRHEMALQGWQSCGKYDVAEPPGRMNLSQTVYVHSGQCPPHTS
jgi:hypothetical protein